MPALQPHGMTDTLDALLYQCTVQLNLAGGTGFFVAPGYVLTCEHVVRGAGAEAIRLRWQNDFDTAKPNRYSWRLWRCISGGWATSIPMWPVA